MSKTIYTEQTLNLLAQKDLEATKTLVASETIKETENNIKYLLAVQE